MPTVCFSQTYSYVLTENDLSTDCSPRYSACHLGDVQVLMCGWHCHVQPHSCSAVSDGPLLPAQCASGSTGSQLYRRGAIMAKTSDSCTFHNLRFYNADEGETFYN